MGKGKGAFQKGERKLMTNVITEALKDLPRSLRQKRYYERLIISKYKINGIKTSALKKCAEELAGKVKLQDLYEIVPQNYEELTLLGLIIAYHDSCIEEKCKALDYYLSFNDNWSSCDTVMFVIKDTGDTYFNYLLNLVGRNDWSVRFGMTGLMTNFMDKEHLGAIYERLHHINYGDYQIDMAVSWFLGIALIDFPTETIEFFESAPLSLFLLRLTVRKAKDSKNIREDVKITIEEALKDILCKRAIC